MGRRRRPSPSADGVARDGRRAGRRPTMPVRNHRPDPGWTLRPACDRSSFSDGRARAPSAPHRGTLRRATPRGSRPASTPEIDPRQKCAHSEFDSGQARQPPSRGPGCPPRPRTRSAKPLRSGRPRPEPRAWSPNSPRAMPCGGGSDGPASCCYCREPLQAPRLRESPKHSCPRLQAPAPSGFGAEGRADWPEPVRARRTARVPRRPRSV